MADSRLDAPFLKEQKNIIFCLIFFARFLPYNKNLYFGAKDLTCSTGNKCGKIGAFLTPTLIAKNILRARLGSKLCHEETKERAGRIETFGNRAPARHWMDAKSNRRKTGCFAQLCLQAVKENRNLWHSARFAKIWSPPKNLLKIHRGDQDTTEEGASP